MAEMTLPGGGGLGALAAIQQGLGGILPALFQMVQANQVRPPIAGYPTQLGQPATGGSPMTLPPQGLPSISLPSITGLGGSGPLPLPPPGNNQTPSWAQGFSGPSPTTFDSLGIGMPDVSNLPLGSIAGNALMDTVLPAPFSALTSIMRGIRGADSFVNGPDAAAANGGTPLPPLSFEGMRKDLGYEDEPAAEADPSGLSIPFDMDLYPKPPTIEAPPGIDEEALQGSTRNSVLGAMAQGAAQVDPTSAGSFARALAGAGGAGATASGDARARAVEVAHKNALGAYQASMKNKELQYEYEGKKFEMMLPDIKATDDSIVVREYNKDKGSYDIRVIKTGGVLADADKLGKMIEAMSGSGPLAEATEVQYISSLYGNDPVAATATLKRMAIERTIENGAGQAVFGEAYANASDKAKNSGTLVPGFNTKPEDYRREHAKLVAAELLANPELMADSEWLVKASQYGSVSANILLKGGYGR